MIPRSPRQQVHETAQKRVQLRAFSGTKIPRLGFTPPKIKTTKTVPNNRLPPSGSENIGREKYQQKKVVKKATREDNVLYQPFCSEGPGDARCPFSHVFDYQFFAAAVPCSGSGRRRLRCCYRTGQHLPEDGTRDMDGTTVTSNLTTTVRVFRTLPTSVRCTYRVESVLESSALLNWNSCNLKNMFEKNFQVTQFHETLPNIPAIFMKFEVNNQAIQNIQAT